MKHFTFENHWDAIKDQLKQRFEQLTDKDLVLVAGRGEELFARLRDKLGYSTRELKSLLDELEAGAAGRMKQFKAKAADIASDVRGRLDDAVEEVKAKGAAAAEDVKVQAGVALKQARKRALRLREEGEEYVRQNPREVLLGALCAGFVAGLMLVRR